MTTMTYAPIACRAGRNALGLPYARTEAYRVTLYPEGGSKAEENVPGIGWCVSDDMPEYVFWALHTEASSVR